MSDVLLVYGYSVGFYAYHGYFVDHFAGFLVVSDFCPERFLRCGRIR